MAQIVLWRRAGANVSLNNIEPKEFFEFTNARITLKPKYVASHMRISYAAARVSANVSSVADLTSAEAEFRAKKGPEKFTRGKYLLWFFTQMATAVHKAAFVYCSKLKTPPKVATSMGVGNVMAVVAPRARCPKSLINFIQDNFLDYIDSVDRSGTFIQSK